MSGQLPDRRPTPSEREHELAMTLATRQVRAYGMSLVIGQEARSKDWYVKELSVERDGINGWGPWCDMIGEMAKRIVAALPAPQTADTLTEDLRASVKAIKK